MSALDLILQGYISNILIILCVFAVIIYFMRKKIIKQRNKVFAYFESQFANAYNKPSKSIKQKLFSQLHLQISADIKLRNEGVIRIAEIGAGNGANLKYFPKGSKVIFVDKNPEFQSYLNDTLKLYPSINVERIVHCFAEDMNEIKKESVDAVILSLVLCSVNHVDRVLSEIKRILAPGGKLYFLEHVKAPSADKKINFLQTILTSSRIWPYLMAGCHLNRDTGKSVLRAGFSHVEIKQLVIKGIGGIIKYHVVGVATK